MSDLINLMSTETPVQALQKLQEDGKIDKQRLLTFGFVNTPIFRNSDRIVVAYVTYWISGWITVCTGEGDELALAGAEWTWRKRPSQDQCLELFYKYCPVKGK